MALRFQNKVVVVTGGGAGIGLSTALRFMHEGARVAVLDLEAGEFHAQAGQGHIAVSGDCKSTEVMADFFALVQEKLGPVDVLFNNVGQSAREAALPFALSVEDTWRFVVEVSLFTAMRASRYVAASMRDRGRGRIVNMSSNAAFVGDVGLADYAAAKMGVVGFTRSLARELAPHGVTVNAVCPGAIATRAHEQLDPDILRRIVAGTPAGYIGTPADVAGAVVFLCSDDARFMTGQTLMIDGGRWML